jgi:hypothetical protein
MPRKNQTRRRKQRGGAYRPVRKTMKNTTRRRPIGYNKPRREPYFTYAKRYAPRNMVEYTLNIAMKPSRKAKPVINITERLPVQKTTTYQYIKSIHHILEQILKDLDAESDTKKYEVASVLAMNLAGILPELQADLGIAEKEDDDDEDEDEEKVEEIIYIIKKHLKQYDRALRTGNIERIENVEATLELIAVTLDEVLQTSKNMINTNIDININTESNQQNTESNQQNTNVNILSGMLKSLAPFQK